jgi:hypothetical protein
MVQGWRDGSIDNYGLVMENDFDGQWAEMVDAVQYSVANPSQMNELVATFSKQEGNYPYLRVSATKVVPEPASMVLALVGAGVLKLASRRKRK